jgi:hypothetical protein
MWNAKLNYSNVFSENTASKDSASAGEYKLGVGYNCRIKAT